ncbi:hypothetical protein [Haloprofundus halobius]|uniref:hypothetical protein n=1 Tax=Haloprofundus halobius TaxID=2876194 RepID=UPI001CCC43C8|nr:hypothetical protein [Haloprofundus halobius]
MDWAEVLFGSSEGEWRTPILGSLAASLVVAIGYLTGVFGSASFVSWGGPSPPLVATLIAIISSGAIAYVRRGFILGGASSCFVFLSTGIVEVFFIYRGFTFSERLGFLHDLEFLIISWGCVFGCIGCVGGELLRRRVGDEESG